MELPSFCMKWRGATWHQNLRVFCPVFQDGPCMKWCWFFHFIRGMGSSIPYRYSQGGSFYNYSIFLRITASHSHHGSKTHQGLAQSLAHPGKAPRSSWCTGIFRTSSSSAWAWKVSSTLWSNPAYASPRVERIKWECKVQPNKHGFAILLPGS